MTIFPDKSRLLLTLGITVMLTACVTTQDFSHIPKEAGTQAALQKYLTEKSSKAFAVAESGTFSYSENGENTATAIYGALLNCEKAANARCTIAAIDNNSTLPLLKAQQSENQKLIAGMQLKHPDALMPQDNWFKPAADTVRTPSAGLHYATPTTIKGVKTINTPELVRRMKEGSITLLDTLGFSRMNATLPGAYLLNGGDYANSDTEKNKAFEARLEKVMTRYFPDKSQALVAFCVSAECWLSVNALIHLRNIGYTNLYWYRTGITDWAYQALPFTNSYQFIAVE